MNMRCYWNILGKEVTCTELFFKAITLAAMLRTEYLEEREEWKLGDYYTTITRVRDDEVRLGMYFKDSTFRIF